MQPFDETFICHLGLSRAWLAQEECCREVGSRRTARRWAQNLVSSLLEMVHGSWRFRNDAVHEKDAQGASAAEGVELTAAIAEQLELGTEGLHPRDHHLDPPMPQGCAPRGGQPEGRGYRQ